LKADYLQKYQANILVMGDDWQGRFDKFRQYCEVLYLPRTPSISTTAIIEVARTSENSQNPTTADAVIL